MRRLLLVAVVCLTVTAGCSGGKPPVSASGAPATVAPDALDATGFERVAAENATLNTTVRGSISGDVELQAQQEVHATTPVRVYRSGETVVGVVSAPAVRPISNQPVYADPVDTLSLDEQVAYAQSVYQVRDLHETATESVTVLGNETTLRTYEGQTDGGTTVVVRVVRVKDDDDFVTVVWVTPASNARDGDFRTLLSNLEH